MIIPIKPEGEIAAYWHRLLTYDPQGHLLIPVRIDVSRLGNLRVHLLCVKCGSEHIETREFQALTNTSVQLDMIQIDQTEPSEPIALYLKEVADE